MTATVGDLLGEQLGLLGATRLFVASAAGATAAAAISGLDVVEVADDELAMLLADADGRVNGGQGAALVTGSILHVSSQPGGQTVPVAVHDAEALVDALATMGATSAPTTVAVQLDLDLAAPAPPGVAARLDRQAGLAITLDPSFADGRVAVVVGPGVLRNDAVAQLHELALSGGLGVVNTWGAKGVFRWDSPFHFGTAGLQARDFELAGVADADIVVTCGLDLHETPLERLGSYVVQDVAPWQLPFLVENWPRVTAPDERPALYSAIASVVTPLYESSSVPLTPARAALHLAGACPDDGVVLADAGAAGFWIARTFPTGTPGSVVVPAIAQPGFAAAGAIVARLAGRAAVAVVDGPLDEATEHVLDAAERLGVAFGVQVWGDDGHLADTAAHVELTRRGFDAGSVTIADVPIDGSALDELVDVAGPVVAWGLGATGSP